MLDTLPFHLTIQSSLGICRGLVPRLLADTQNLQLLKFLTLKKKKIA